MTLPIRLSPAGFPMAPTQEEWDALSSTERAAVVAALPGEVTDAEMTPPEGDRHFKAKTKTLGALRSYFSSAKRRVYLAAELPVYYPNAPRFAPDLLAVLDVEDHDRDKWIVSAEGRGLDWVMEVHVGGDRKKDAERNVVRYAQLGIPEYFLYDRSKNSLFAYRLSTPSATTYTPIVPQAGLYASNVLGLEVQVQKDRLRFYAGSAMLLESEELISRLEDMLEQAQTRAEEEARRREEEARRREEVEAENAKLRAELEALKKK
ncbi:MAG: Uma2 family endonuclease [Labilithrix sp.]|nr:Uma2 family endonuclease [Labilithrix sp.]MCW5812425.1 Uma2 family endonuclease [Labilithrix sp.]